MLFGLLVVLLAGAGLWALVIYNQFSQMREHLEQSWTAIDQELAYRHDIAERIGKIAGAAAQLPPGTLDRLMRAREAATAAYEANAMPADRALAEAMLTRVVRHLLSLAGSVPQLRAMPTFVELAQAWLASDERLTAGCTAYNEAAVIYDTKLVKTPDKFVAQALKFEPVGEFSPTSASAQV